MKNTISMNGHNISVDKIFEMYSIFNTVYVDLSDYIDIFGEKIEYVIKRAYTTDDYLSTTGESGLATTLVKSLIAYHKIVSQTDIIKYGFKFDPIIIIENNDEKRLKDGFTGLKSFVAHVKCARDTIGDYIKKIIDNIDNLGDL